MKNLYLSILSYDLHLSKIESIFISIWDHPIYDDLSILLQSVLSYHFNVSCMRWIVVFISSRWYHIPWLDIEWYDSITYILIVYNPPLYDHPVYWMDYEFITYTRYSDNNLIHITIDRGRVWCFKKYIDKNNGALIYSVINSIFKYPVCWDMDRTREQIRSLFPSIA